MSGLGEASAFISSAWSHVEASWTQLRDAGSKGVVRIDIAQHDSARRVDGGLVADAARRGVAARDLRHRAVVEREEERPPVLHVRARHCIKRALASTPIHFTFRRTSRIGPLTDVSVVPTE